MQYEIDNERGAAHLWVRFDDGSTDDGIFDSRADAMAKARELQVEERECQAREREEGRRANASRGHPTIPHHAGRAERDDSPSFPWWILWVIGAVFIFAVISQVVSWVGGLF